MADNYFEWPPKGEDTVQDRKLTLIERIEHLDAQRVGYEELVRDLIGQVKQLREYVGL